MAYVHFKNKSGYEAALRRSRNKMGTKKVTVIKASAEEISQVTSVVKSAANTEKLRPWEYKVLGH